jgi:hypothetical protein
MISTLFRNLEIPGLIFGGETGYPDDGVVLLGFWCRVDSYVDTIISEKHTLSTFRAVDGDNRPMFFRNVDIYLRIYTASKPRRTTSSSSPPEQPQFSPVILSFS